MASSKTKLLVDDDGHDQEGRPLEVRRSEAAKSNHGHAGHAASASAAAGGDNAHHNNGLSTAEAQRLFNEHGPNEITEKKQHWFLKLLTYFVGPIPFLMEVATLISLVLFIYEESIKAADADPATWVVLGILLLVNGLMGFKEEASAGDAIEALKASLAPQARCKRDGTFVELPARELVPGDLIILKGGDIVPADSKLHEGEPMEVDQAALTGESLPVTCFPGDVVYSGSVVKRGELHATVYATGGKTFFGKAAALVNSVNARGHLQQVLLKVAYALMFSGIILVVILFVTLLVQQGQPWASALVSCLVLLVASIPIAMQVVTTATMAVGARNLAESKAIVARLASIEELAGMTILCSDKTGTLTKNKLTLDTPTVFFGKDDDVIFSAALCAKWEGQDAIDMCLTNGVANQDYLFQHKQIKFIPFDPVNKRTESTILAPDGSQFRVSKGAPQVIAAMAHNCSEIAQRVDDVIEEFGQRGFRAIGVARTNESGVWEFQGLIPLFDPPRDDTKATIESALAMGVEVKMITGDHMTIAKETCRRLGMGTNIYTIDALEAAGSDDLQGQMAETADGFAQVFPEHKFRIVEVLQKRGHLTGMTGDGVNDAPALKKADVGIAVEGATDAARAAADIVLTEPGLSVIIIAMVKAREIFLRMKAYVIYRIAATITLLLFMFFSQILLKSKAAPECNVLEESEWTGFPYPVTTSCVTKYYGAGCTCSSSGCNGLCDDMRSGKSSLYYDTSDSNYPHFTLPAIVLVILTILNDGTILSIAYDRVVADAKPQQWRLLRVLAVCSVLGLLGFAECLIGFIVLSNSYITPIEKAFSASIGHVAYNTERFPLTPGQIETCVYLFLSVGGQAIVFAARTSGPFFSRRPGNLLMCAFLFAQLTSILFALFWPFGGSLEGLAMYSFTNCLGVGPFINLNANPGGVILKGVTLYNVGGKFGPNNGLSTYDVKMDNQFCTACEGSSNTCFLHATPNPWAVGFCIFWAIIWFLTMDFAKIFIYRYFEAIDKEEDRVERRRLQKRLSVAMESERRATMGTATAVKRPPQPGSVQAAVAKQESHANVPASVQRAIEDLQHRMTALDKEQKELRTVLEEYLRSHP